MLWSPHSLPANYDAGAKAAAQSTVQHSASADPARLAAASKRAADLHDGADGDGGVPSAAATAAGPPGAP